MAKKLTARSIEQVKPDPNARREIPDGLLTGLYFIVQPSGAKSWAVRYRHGGKPRKHTLGPYPALDLGEAREKAKAALLSVATGDDPTLRKKVSKQGTRDGRDLVKIVVAEFLARHASKHRSAPEIERMFRHDVLPYWGERRLQDIARRDVVELLDLLTDRGVGMMTNRVFSIVRKLFNWAMSRDIIAVSPCAGVRPPVVETSRDRVLSDDEIRLFWKATERLGYPFEPLFKLLLLTGQRRAEVAEMTWAEIDLGKRHWVLPKERTKNGTAHDVPLSAPVLDILATLPRIAGSDYLFTTTGETAVSGFSRAKDGLDRAMGDIPAWKLHDLRRTAASGMARLNINLPVIEKVLNHTSGSFAGIVGVYQRHQFADEKRHALEVWAAFVQRLGTDMGGNIVELKARPQ